MMIIERARELGVGDGEFHPSSVIGAGGGVKGVSLPPDYKEQVDRFYGDVVRPAVYGMTELAQPLPRCEAGSYHAAPGLIMLPLDESGERLLTGADAADGLVEARFGFLDLAYEGRWGGLITGDKVTVDFAERCPCGRSGPTLLDNIGRFVRPGEDDHIGCAGTIDAYIRGAVQRMTATQESTAVRVPHVVKGERLTGADCEYGRAGARFATPALDLNALVWPRNVPGPAFDVPVAEIIDLLVQVGDWLRSDPEGLLEEALVAARVPARCRRGRRPVLRAPAEGVRPREHGVPDQGGARWPRRAGRMARDRRRPDRAGAPDPRLPAATGPRHRRQLARRRRRLDRAWRADQGPEPDQAAVERSLHRARDPAGDGARRARASGDPLVLRGVLARRRRAGRGHAVPPAVLRQARRLGWRRDHRERAEVRRTRLRAGRVRPQDIDLADRP